MSSFGATGSHSSSAGDHSSKNKSGDDDPDKGPSTNLKESDQGPSVLENPNNAQSTEEPQPPKLLLGNTRVGDTVWEFPKLLDATMNNLNFDNLINLHYACESYIWMENPENQTPGSDPGDNTKALLDRLTKLATKHESAEEPSTDKTPTVSTNERK